MFLKNLALFSSVLAITPSLTSSLNINQSCDDYFDREGVEKFDDKTKTLYQQLSTLIDYNFNNTVYYTKKSQTRANEIGKYGDFVTGEQLGINLNFKPQNFETKRTEEYVGHKLTIDLNLIQLSLRIYKVDNEKGIVSTAKKITYKDYCFYHRFAIVVYGFKK